MRASILWEWTNIALCIRIYKQSNYSNHHIGVDIQIL